MTALKSTDEVQVDYHRDTADGTSTLEVRVNGKMILELTGVNDALFQYFIDDTEEDAA